MATRSSIRFATREEGVSFNEMPETTMIQPKEPSPKGLMARLSKEEE